MIDFIGNNLGAIVLVLAGLCLLTIVMLQSLQISRLKQRIDALTGGEEGDLEAVLGQHLEIVHEVGRDLDELTARTAVLESAGRHHYNRQGLVRFNPFDDTGGSQSFALALLDESADGLIISSLHSRTGTRIYAKAVVNGKAEATLSTEEAQAIEEARISRALGPAAAGRAAASRTKAAAAAALGRANKATPAIGETVAEPKASAVDRFAPAATTAKVATAKVETAPAVTVEEAADRLSMERVKGQVKSKGAGDNPGTESENMGRKPGRQPASEATEKADTPNS